jgi:hypothetical protein
MEKRTIILVVVIFLVGLGTWYYYQKDGEVDKKLRYEAYKDLENIKRKYGAYGQNNEELNEMVEIEFQMEEWKFGWQEPFNLIDTNDSDLPFLATEEIVFVSPDDKNIIRELTKMYIYDLNNFQWIPLKSTLKEINLGNKNYNILEDSRIWQGDWEIPFF